MDGAGVRLGSEGPVAGAVHPDGRRDGVRIGKPCRAPSRATEIE